jgi:DNA mismatch repair ATPase MutS
MLSPDDVLGFRDLPSARCAFTELLGFMHRCGSDCLSGLTPPEVAREGGASGCGDAGLAIHSTAMRQLDIAGGPAALLDCITPCVTALGKRLARARLCAPSADPVEIGRRLDMVSLCCGIEDGKDCKGARLGRVLRARLSGCADLERVGRLMAAGCLPARELPRLLETAEKVFGAGEAFLAEGGGTLSVRVDAAAQAHETLLCGVLSVVRPEAIIANEAGGGRRACIFAPGFSPELDRLHGRLTELEGMMDALLSDLNTCSGSVDGTHFREDIRDGGASYVATSASCFARAKKEMQRREFRLPVFATDAIAWAE